MLTSEALNHKPSHQYHLILADKNADSHIPVRPVRLSGCGYLEICMLNGHSYASKI